MFFFFFFFSSRRRHTRSLCDWSSDVCSSDLAKAANVPIVVAINKIDKPEAQPERVKRQLSDLGLMPAEWGGDTEFVEIGRASCRERGEIWGGGVSFKKKRRERMQRMKWSIDM